MRRNKFGTFEIDYKHLLPPLNALNPDGTPVWVRHSYPTAIDPNFAYSALPRGTILSPDGLHILNMNDKHAQMNLFWQIEDFKRIKAFELLKEQRKKRVNERKKLKEHNSKIEKQKKDLEKQLKTVEQKQERKLRQIIRTVNSEFNPEIRRIQSEMKINLYIYLNQVYF